MSFIERINNHLIDLQVELQQEIDQTTAWFEREHDRLELEFASELDLLRLEAQKQAGIAEAYRKCQLLEKITPEEQAVKNELQTQWKKGTCVLLRDARYGPHCALPVKTSISCPYLNKDGIKEVLYFNGTQELHFPCTLRGEVAG